ncbi:MAG: EthD domain-containing protein [Candidatus Rokuibacteriota bacterium]
MIKLTFCLRRLPHLSREDFRRYWLEVHGPLVHKHAAALRIKRYVQVHADAGPLSDGLRKVRGAPEPFDGVAELWFESAEDLQAAGRTPEGRAAGAALLEDERRFIDLTRSPLWLGQERPIV